MSEKQKFTPDDLMAWAFAIMISMLFLSCGAAPLVKVFR